MVFCGCVRNAVNIPTPLTFILGEEKKIELEMWNYILVCVEFLLLALVNCRYMRGRLTLEKVNAAIGEIATYAEANAQLISAPRKKLAENMWEKALVNILNHVNPSLYYLSTRNVHAFV